MKSDWLPIESAPKDRAVLLYWPAYRYDVEEEPYGRIAIGRWKENGRISRGYFADNSEMDDYGLAETSPSHWMQIPAPPSAFVD